MAAAETLSLQENLQGPRAWRIIREFTGNSAFFPFLLALLEINLKGLSYFMEPSHWALLFSAVLQAIFLSRHGLSPNRLFFGNLIGVSLYSLVDIGLEGLPKYLQGPEHSIYWSFSFLIGVLQASRELFGPARPFPRDALRTMESAVRALIVLAVYFLSVMKAGGGGFSETAAQFFGHPPSSFLSQGILIFGLLYGVSEVLLARNRAILIILIDRLRRYSSWFVEAKLIEHLVESGGESPPARAERTILFMDIRGFTSWSSARQGAEVGEMLNGYYEKAGPVISRHGGLMNTLTGDEVMAIFHAPIEAVKCALEMQREISSYLEGHSLGAGVGIHCGEVVEGLFGTSNKKVFSVMGMSVNIAKRLEGCAERGKIVVSEPVLRRVSGMDLTVLELPAVNLKGVPDPMSVFELT